MPPVGLHAPIEHEIILELVTNKQVVEQLAEIEIIRLLLETESAGVIQKDTELGCEDAAK